ncbi:glucose-6-phosphate dehydrogenase [Lapidilactobacillus achengensis]|uniref:Glucose-6-phosphate 1-dehydrogenase n=1 Tax=Lapidilactobacillus achengensis TaxID=2486000 RepID=A0ABW1UQY3_9LACO|nr:glucose-6-phosphate dehydrogenase [Lapidilactobacillus achengensis]
MNENEKRVLMVIFGGSGDLAHRKLYPALFELYLKGQLDQHFAVIGTARRPWTHDYFRQTVAENLQAGTAAQQQAFVGHFYYQSHDVQDADHYIILKKLIDTLDEQYQLHGNRIFYMAMRPALFGTIAAHLKSEHLLSASGFNRLIIEKPFGHDYQSALALNDAVISTFARDQVYRIDHYLGKEMVQNIPYLRFDNPLMAAVWNHDYIDNIQITLAEKLGVEERGGYYETAGALRDMVQNHIMQIIAMLAMPRPADNTDQAITAARREVFTHLHQYDATEIPRKFIRGQYGPSEDGQALGYRQEDKIDPKSNVETFVAGEIQLDLPQWQGVPFYVRTGKRLPLKKTRIDVVFKSAAQNLFGSETLAAPVLTIEVEPEMGLTWHLNAKEVGQSTSAIQRPLHFALSQTEAGQVPDAYERLILEAINGRRSNFVSWQDMSGAWQFIDGIRQVWEECQCPHFPNYPAGTMGPAASDQLLQASGRHWIFTN